MEKVILQQWFSANNKRDWDTVKNLYSEDAIIHGKERELTGGQAVVDLAKNWVDSFPDAKLETLHVSTEEDVVIVHWKCSGTFANAIFDIDPTNKSLVFHGLTCFRCHGDKIIEHWASVDYRPLYKKKS